MAGRKKKTTHSSGMYRKRITLGHDPKTGKPIVKAVYAKSTPELENKIARLRVDKGMGIVVTDDKSTFGYWAKTWKSLAYPPMERATKDMYDAALTHLKCLYPKKISQLTSLDLSVIVTQMETGENEKGKKYSKRTVKSVISTARQISQLARKNHALMFNLAEDIRPNKEDRVNVREAISKDEEELIWNVVPLHAENKMDEARAKRLPMIRMFALMQLNCGLRKEEAAALRWKNVDLKKKIVTVEEAFSYAKNDVKEPKSQSGYRTLPIPDKYAKELEAWKKQNERDGSISSIYVFPGRKGIITAGEFRRLWDTLIDAINGITVSKRISVKRKKKGPVQPVVLEHDFNSHQLRHTYATNCIASGIDVKTLQYLLGHSTPEMAMKYTHFHSGAIEEARQKMNAPLSKESDVPAQKKA
jgi:Site-specific recombinase XerD